MLSNEWVIAGTLIALLAGGLMVPGRTTRNPKGDRNRGKLL